MPLDGGEDAEGEVVVHRLDRITANLRDLHHPTVIPSANGCRREEGCGGESELSPGVSIGCGVLVVVVSDASDRGGVLAP